MRLGKPVRLWEKPAVRVSAFGDVIKVWVWALGSLLIALGLTPLAFNGGKALSELSASKDFNGIVNRVADWSGSATLGDFFIICWPVAAALLLFPLTEWLRPCSNADVILQPQSTGEVPTSAQRAISWDPWLRALYGFLATFGCFTLIGYVMQRMGAIGWESDANAWREDLLFHIGVAVALTVLAEVFYRRVVMGIFLKAMSAPKAIALSALMFGGVHYIHSGFGTAEKLDGETLSAIHLTAIILGGGDLAARVVASFLPWFAFGCVLGWARWRTASLWLPSGLLLGWLLAERLFSKGTHTVATVPTGLVAMLGVVAVGVFVHLITKDYGKQKNAD